MKGISRSQCDQDESPQRPNPRVFQHLAFCFRNGGDAGCNRPYRAERDGHPDMSSGGGPNFDQAGTQSDQDQDFQQRDEDLKEPHGITLEGAISFPQAAPSFSRTAVDGKAAQASEVQDQLKQR